MAESLEVSVTGQSVGLVERRYFAFGSEADPFLLECGESLPHVSVCYEAYGKLNRAGDNAVLITHGITGSSHAAGRYQPDSKYPGYWELLIGPGRVIDTEKYFVIAPNILGGCRGSTGPMSIDPRTGRPYGLSFPMVTIRDMVRTQKVLLDHLGVTHLTMVTGGSMGGMQALEWAVQYPDFVDGSCPIASSAFNSVQAIAFNECMRRAIMLDPAWANGDYYGSEPPAAGLALARAIGTITYLSEGVMQGRFGQRLDESIPREHPMHMRFDIEAYLQDEGDKLVKRFDANSYLYISRAIDLHDISNGFESLDQAYGSIRAKVLSIAIRSDILFYPHRIREMHDHMLAAGVDSTYWEMDSDYGHDAFLVEQDKIIEPLARFLSRLPSRALPE